MGQTVLQLIQAACYEANIPAPSALVGSTDTSTLQLLHLFYAAGRDLRASKCWDQLKRQASIFLQARRRTYKLPQDCYTILPNTAYDSRTRWGVQTAQMDSEAEAIRYGAGTSGIRLGFRVFGAENANDDKGQIELDQVPGDSDAGQRITLNYITKSWLSPPLWTASESVAQNTWRFSAGRNYKKTDSGTEAGDVIPPNMAFAIGREGNVIWRAISPAAWSSSHSYKADDFVSNGGNYYRCTVSGESASSGGPSGTSSSITDGTVTWEYKEMAAWNEFTTYEKGDCVFRTTFFFIAVEGGQSSENYPRFTTTTVTDNLITWTWQPQAYETIVTDSDLCLFDDELMIAALIWRFLRSKGLAYEDRLGEFEQLKDAAASRWNPGKVIRLGYPQLSGPRYPICPDGGFNA